MKVYIDLVLVINFIFDFILLSSVNYILRRNTKIYRLILSSLIGTFTLLILFIEMNIFVLLIFKFVISLIMLLIAFGYHDIRFFSRNIINFYLVSMLMGGGIYFLKSQFSYTNNGLVFIDGGLGISYLIILLLGIFIYFRYIKCFKELKNNYSNYYKCKIYFNDYFIEVNAFLDTGNKLVDPYTNNSIVLLQEKKFKSCNLSPIFVPFNSLNNHGLLTCYKALKLEIDGKCYEKFLVGISKENFFIDGIDCIINNMVMEGLR